MAKEDYMQKSILDQYEILTALDQREHVFLVKEKESRDLFVEKHTRVGDRHLYELMRQQQFKGMPHIHDMSEEQGKLILIEDYIHGDNLEKMLDQQGGILPEGLVINYMLQLCRILKQFHFMDPPVIHRDIKPANIIVSKDGVVYLIDFNSARIYKPDSDHDTSYLVSHHFSAPELYGFGQSDPRTDLYSIGAAMHFLLTGTYLKEKPYQGPLKIIIEKCTEINPKDRYQNLAELEQALEEIRLTMEQGLEKSGLVMEEGLEENCLLVEQGLEERGLVLEDTLEERSLPLKTEQLLPADGKESRVRSMTIDGTDDSDRPAGRADKYVEGIQLKGDKMIPGFRTMHPLKVLVAVPTYLLIIFTCLTLEIKSTLKPGLAVFDLWVQRLSVLIFFILSIFLIFNYRNWQDKVPFCNQNRSKAFKAAVGIFLLFGIELAALVIFETILSLF